ncbi:MAG: hypothetical protein R3E33_06115 [Rhodocyclaceae bacterium]
MMLRSLVLPLAAAMLLAACAEKPQPEAQLPAVVGACGRCCCGP